MTALGISRRDVESLRLQGTLSNGTRVATGRQVYMIDNPMVHGMYIGVTPDGYVTILHDNKSQWEKSSRRDEFNRLCRKVYGERWRTRVYKNNTDGKRNTR